MKNKLKEIIMTLSLVLLVFAMAGGKSIKAEAKTVKDGAYYFSSTSTTKFQIKNNKLTLKVAKDGTGITKVGDESFKKYKLTLKVSKNCKYRQKYYGRSTGESSVENMDYSGIKKAIAWDRQSYKETGGLYNNYGLSEIVVKNNRVTKIVYLLMP